MSELLEARIRKCAYAIKRGGNRAAIDAELQAVMLAMGEVGETGNRLCVERLKEVEAARAR